ncbi:MAG: alpha/beta hydrolase [Lachnospiraceae bacterium]|nr:alpha/beta hydrolase [Lachnospiraceae bacterium]
MESDSNRKLAVIFPGMGYNTYGPLLYYSGKLAKADGYELKLDIEYHDLPQKIRGDLNLMQEAASKAYECVEAQLSGIDWTAYKDILFIGKSIGTVVAGKYNKEHKIGGKQIWYTPVEATFKNADGTIEAFIGDADPWSDIEKVKELAVSSGIPLHIYPGCNHSLESGDIIADIRTISDVMEKTRNIL